MRASVKAELRPSTYDVVTAVIPGADAAGRGDRSSRHLCHQETGRKRQCFRSGGDPRGRRAEFSDSARRDRTASPDDQVHLAAGDQRHPGLLCAAPRRGSANEGGRTLRHGRRELLDHKIGSPRHACAGLASGGGQHGGGHLRRICDLRQPESGFRSRFRRRAGFAGGQQGQSGGGHHAL